MNPEETTIAFGGREFNRRLEEAGAKSGDIQISLMWNNVNDLDLHCMDPRKEIIFYGHRRSVSGGELDVDRNASGTMPTEHPVENIFWPASRASSGAYKVYVNHFANRGGPDPTQFVVRTMVKGRSMFFTNAISHGQQLIFVHKFNFESDP